MSDLNTSRRTIVKGAAWAVPAISAAAAAPSLAASPEPTPDIDLSTSTPGAAGVVRQTDTQMNISATTFRNTGTVPAEGLVVTFAVDSGQTIEGIQVFGSDIKNVAQGATTSGYGTNTVTLTLAPGTGLGQVTIAPGSEYTSPVGQDILLGQAGAFNLTVTVQASNATANSVGYMPAPQAIPA